LDAVGVVGGDIKRRNHVFENIWVGWKSSLPRFVSSSTTWAEDDASGDFDYLYKGICNPSIIEDMPSKKSQKCLILENEEKMISGFNDS